MINAIGSWIIFPHIHTLFLRYHASDMILNIDSDAAYLVLPNARSRIAGIYHLTNHSSPHKSPFLNAPILVEYKTL